MDIGVFFNPQGRIGPKAFLNAAIVLIVIGAVFTLMPLFGTTFVLLSALSIVLLYPWLVIWVKRFHDADKSGWLFLVALLIYLVAGYALGLALAPMLGVDMTASSTTDPAAMLATISEQQRKLAIPNTILGVVISLVMVLAGNALLKRDPEPNPYGAPSSQ